MMEEVEAAMDVVQTEDKALLQVEDHLHIVLMEGHQTEDHQMEGHLPAVLMIDHQMAGAVLHGQETADHLQPVTAKAAMADLIAHHQKGKVVHQVADVDVKKVVLLTDKFSPDNANEK